MKTGSIIALIIIIVVIAVGVWWFVTYQQNPYATGPATYAPSSTTSGSTTTTSTTYVLSASTNPTVGTYLVAANGMTLYHYTKDSPGVSTCTGQCATLWPAYTVSSSTTLPIASGVSGTIGVIKNPSGALQVTYNNQPLYFYYKDVNPGDTNGQNVGGIWFIVTP